MKVLARRGFFYGWIIVAVVFLAFFSPATGSVMVVVLKPMAEALNRSREATAFAVSVSGISMAILSPFIGPFVDRWGGRLVMVIGGILVSGLFFGLSRITTLWQLYALYAMADALSRGAIRGVSGSSTVARWFIRRRGRAMALATMGEPMGSALWVIVAQRVSDIYDWRTTWLVMGVAILVVLVVPAGLFMRRRPEDLGLKPDGATQPIREAASSLGRSWPSGTEVEGREDRSWTVRDAMKTKALWLILLLMMVTQMALSGVWFHLYSHLTDLEIPGTVAAAALSILAITSTVGRLFWGFASEFISLRRAYFLSLLACSGALVWVTWARSVGVVFGAVSLYGLAIGGPLVLEYLILPDYYGRTYVGTFLGFAMVALSIGSGAGAWLSGRVFDVTGTYLAAFIIFTFSFLVAALLLLMAKAPHRATVAESLV